MDDRNFKTLHRIGGFTLVELLIVLTIAIMIATMAVPAMTGLIANSRRTAATTELLLAMNLARSEAVKRRLHVTMCKSRDGEKCGHDDVSWNDGWIVFANDSSASVDKRDKDEELLQVSDGINPALTILPDAGVSNFIAFRPNGRTGVTGFFASCDYRGSEHARVVAVLASGRASVSEYTPAGEAPQCGD